MLAVTLRLLPGTRVADDDSVAITCHDKQQPHSQRQAVGWVRGRASYCMLYVTD